MGGNSFQNGKRIEAINEIVRDEIHHQISNGQKEKLIAAFVNKQPNNNQITKFQDYYSQELKAYRGEIKDTIFDKFKHKYKDLYDSDKKQTVSHAYWAEKDYRKKRYALEIPVKVSIIAVGIIGGVLLKDYFEGIGWSSLAGSLVAGAAVTLPLALLYYLAKTFISPATKSHAQGEVRDKEMRHEIEGVMQENVWEITKSKQEVKSTNHQAQDVANDLSNHCLWKQQVELC